MIDLQKLRSWIALERRDHPKECFMVDELIEEHLTNKSGPGKINSPGLDRMEDKDYGDNDGNVE